MGGARAGAAPEDLAFVQRLLAERGGPAVPLNFQRTVPGYNPNDPQMQRVRCCPARNPALGTDASVRHALKDVFLQISCLNRLADFDMPVLI